MSVKAGRSLTTATKELAARLTAQEGKSAENKEVFDCWKHCLGLINLKYPTRIIYQELSARLRIAELNTLAAILESAIKTGASLPQVFMQSATGLREQLELKETLESALASRRTEGMLLGLAPPAYIVLLKLFTPSYMAPLYTGAGLLAAAVAFGLHMGGCVLFFKLLLREETERPDMVLAGFQEELSLQLRAGLSLPEAWLQAQKSQAADCGKTPTNDLGQDSIRGALAYVARQLAAGVPFGKALDDMLAKIRKGEVVETDLKRMLELMRQSYQMGGDSLGTMMSLEARQTRSRALHQSQAQGNKLQTWTLFPMIMLLVSVLLLTAAPALLSM